MDLAAVAMPPPTKERKTPRLFGTAAIVPVNGPIYYGEDEYTSHQEIKANIKAAMNQADFVVLDIDSPGGTVTGTLELSNWIAQQAKPIVAYSSGMMASAAYWIGSHAHLLGASPASTVGSIGTILQVADVTKALEQMGIQIHTFASGKYKAVGNPFKALTEDHKEHLQERVMELAEGFKQAVSSMRPKASREIMDGRTMSGSKAYDAGLVDFVANDIEEFIQQITES